MENLDEKGVSWIKEERLKVLKGNYIKPEVGNFISTHPVSDGECSDMASMECFACCGDLQDRCGGYYNNR